MQIAKYVIVGMLWGCTNPFIKHAQAKQKSSVAADSSWVTGIRNFVLQPDLLIPYVINQSGSLFFFIFIMPTDPITISAPICNSLSFIFTAITSYGYFKEELHSWQHLFLGILLVLIGSFVCINSEHS